MSEGVKMEDIEKLMQTMTELMTMMRDGLQDIWQAVIGPSGGRVDPPDP